MLDETEKVIEEEKPDLIIPEVEAMATDKRIQLENKGFTVIPTLKRQASPWTERVFVNPAETLNFC